MTTSIRAGTRADLSALCALYEPYVRETAVTFDLTPPTLAQREAWYDERFVETDDVFLAIERDGEPVGFGWSGPWRSKAAYFRSTELSVYLAHGHTGRGLGSQLLSTLIDTMRARGRHRALGGVTVPNPASRAMLTKHGFVSVGVFSEVGDKFGKFWDVEWFERAL
jgi:phosphinothricin acetyltransferase